MFYLSIIWYKISMKYFIYNNLCFICEFTNFKIFKNNDFLIKKNNSL